MKYKVLLVDDEKYVRIWLKNCIDWGEQGFEIVGEAKNGEEALEMIENLGPELVISDMEMPKLNGNGLMQNAREKFPGICFVVISGYNDFTYLRSAIQNQAMDYLLKPIKEPDLREVLSKVKKKLDIQFDELIRSHNAYLKQLAMQNQQCALKLLSGLAVNEEVESVFAGCDKWCVFILSPVANEEEREGIRNRFECHSICCEEVSISGRSVFVTAWNDEEITGKIREIALSALPKGKQLSMGGVKAITAQVSGSYAEANFALQYPPMELEKNFFAYQMVNWDKKDPVDASMEQRFLAAMNRNDEEAVNLVINDIFNVCANSDAKMQMCRMACCKLFSVLLRYSFEVGVLIESLKISETEMFLILRQSRTPEEMRKHLQEVVYDFCNQINKNALLRSHPSVMAQEFIKNNFSHDISLEDIARYAGVSANYLCTIFRRNYGKSVFDFVTALRIENAKQLLITKDLKIYEVSQLSGYQEAKYFCKIFKKITGISPNEYRQNYTPK